MVGKSREERYVVSVLDGVAFAVRNGFPRSVVYCSSNLKYQYRQYCDETARGFESYAIQAATATLESANSVKESIAHDMLCLIRGHDGGLTKVPSVPLGRRTALSRTFSTLRSLLAGIIPLVLVLTLPRIGIELPLEVRGPAVAISLILALISTLTLLDPSIAGRADAVRSLADNLRGGLGGGPSRPG